MVSRKWKQNSRKNSFLCLSLFLSESLSHAQWLSVESSVTTSWLCSGCMRIEPGWRKEAIQTRRWKLKIWFLIEGKKALGEYEEGDREREREGRYETSERKRGNEASHLMTIRWRICLTRLLKTRVMKWKAEYLNSGKVLNYFIIQNNGLLLMYNNKLIRCNYCCHSYESFYVIWVSYET